MKKFIAFMFVMFLFASSSSYALDFIKLGTSHDADYWGNTENIYPGFISAVQYLAERGKFQTNPLDTLDVTDENVQDALSGVFGPFDALLFSETIEPLTNETYGLINDYVSSGGCVIVTGSHEDEFGAEAEFVNNSFGYNISAPTIDDLIPFTIQPGAIGTVFEGGPPVLLSADASEAFGNTPGTAIYSGAEGVIVFTDEFGAGDVTAIGWDYCCEPPDPGQAILDWFELMNRALEQCQPEPRMVPTLSEWGLISMAGILGIVGFMVMRRRQITA